jgi:EpsI family protein
MLGHLSDNRIATGVDHLVYGWVFFGVIILGLFFIGARWADPDDSDGAVARAEAAGRLRQDAPAPGWKPLAIVGVAMLALVWPQWLDRSGGPAGAPVLLELPQRLGAWQAQPLPAGSWTPYFPTASLRRHALYSAPQGQVAVHLAYYRGQGGEVKLVTSENRFVDGSDGRWHLLTDRPVTVPMGNAGSGGTLVWREATLLPQDGGATVASSHGRLTVWRLYWLGGPTAHDDVRAKLLQAWQAVRGEPDDGAVIHIASSAPDAEAARAQLAAFVRENFGPLTATLSQARTGR